jgi:Flp pilus assembly protein TadD
VSCRAVVPRGHGYCTSCGEQARLVCNECDRPVRKDWSYCPACGGDPVWEEAGVRSKVARLTGDEPEDPSAWVPSGPRGGQDAEALNAAAIRAYESDDFREAARLFRQAAEADPENASYWTNLGVALGELDDDLEAFAAYRRAIELNPRELSAYVNMGYLYNERERNTEAREAWEKVIQLAPDSEEAEEARRNLRNVEEI